MVLCQSRLLCIQLGRRCVEILPGGIQLSYAADSFGGWGFDIVPARRRGAYSSIGLLPGTLGAANNPGGYFRCTWLPWWIPIFFLGFVTWRFSAPLRTDRRQRGFPVDCEFARGSRFFLQHRKRPVKSACRPTCTLSQPAQVGPTKACPCFPYIIGYTHNAQRRPLCGTCLAVQRARLVARPDHGLAPYSHQRQARTIRCPSITERSAMSTTGKSKNFSAKAKKALDRPFAPAILAKARKIASKYR